MRWGSNWILAMLVCMAALNTQDALSQVGQLDENLPTDSFLGEQFCFQTNFTNLGSPGFGPYIRLDLPPELTFGSASIFGVGGSVTDVGLFPAAPAHLRRVGRGRARDPGLEYPS